MNTTTTLYIVKIYCEDATITVETNSASTMLDHINSALEADVPCEVICGTTGEVLMSHDCGCGENHSHGCGCGSHSHQHSHCGLDAFEEENENVHPAQRFMKRN